MWQKQMFEKLWSYLSEGCYNFELVNLKYEGFIIEVEYDDISPTYERSRIKFKFDTTTGDVVDDESPIIK